MCRTLELAGGLHMRYVDCAPVLRELAVGADEVASALRDGRDVLPGAYEGGLKTWECALDLVDWLARHPAVSEKLFAHKRVLEVLNSQQFSLVISLITSVANFGSSEIL